MLKSRRGLNQKCTYQKKSESNPCYGKATCVYIKHAENIRKCIFKKDNTYNVYKSKTEKDRKRQGKKDREGERQRKQKSI